MNKVFPWIFFGVAEAILIAAMILWRGPIPDNILALNIIVASIILAMFTLTWTVKPAKSNDPSQKGIAAIGVLWVGRVIYAVAAICVMAYCNLDGITPFSTQLIIQLVLVLFLAVMIFASFMSSRQAETVYKQEQTQLNQRADIRFEMRRLKDLAEDTPTLAPDIKEHIRRLSDEMRYITPPSRSEDYREMQAFVDEIRNAMTLVGLRSTDQTPIRDAMRRVERQLGYVKARR